MTLRWLHTNEGAGNACPHPRNGSRRKGFLDRTLEGVAAFFRDGLFSEEYARKPGILQGIDPRVKVLSVLLFVVTVSFLRHFTLIAGIYAGILLAAHFSRVPVGFFITRVWLFVPLFAGVISLPALFNVVVPGEAVVTLMKFDSPWRLGPLKIPATLSITRQGINVASVFVMRVATSVSFVVLLLLTTRWSHLLKALKVLFVPQIFTFIIGMTYRYIHLLLRIIQDIHLAKKSRVIVKGGLKEGQKWVASQMGIVLAKSLLISEDVYSAMQSRGYSREVKIIDTFRMRKADYCWACFSVLAAMLAVYLNRLSG
ncbi:MAG: cobalt ECF transporter T component CbiQ [Deltaproteobacteria bacterium]|nr:cobalt ECF transporter T component CbiQ [Deltaproteobacteria bacterium]